MGSGRMGARPRGARANGASASRSSGKTPKKKSRWRCGTASSPGLPGWYDEYDTDKDGQVSLYEWRKSGKVTDEFLEMDLNGDGLVTADEYLRFARQR